jgi:hypothetical protein
LAPRVEQHLLGRIACEPTKNFFDLALLSTLGSPNEVTSRLPESTVCGLNLGNPDEFDEKV